MQQSIESINIVLSAILEEFDAINNAAKQPIELETDLPNDTMAACEKVLDQLSWAACLANEVEDELTEAAIDELIKRTYSQIDQI